MLTKFKKSINSPVFLAKYLNSDFYRKTANSNSQRVAFCTNMSGLLPMT